MHFTQGHHWGDSADPRLVEVKHLDLATQWHLLSTNSKAFSELFLPSSTLEVASDAYRAWCQFPSNRQILVPTLDQEIAYMQFLTGKAAPTILATVKHASRADRRLADTSIAWERPLIQAGGQDKNDRYSVLAELRDGEGNWVALDLCETRAESLPHPVAQFIYAYRDDLVHNSGDSAFYTETFYTPGAFHISAHRLKELQAEGGDINSSPSAIVSAIRTYLERAFTEPEEITGSIRLTRLLFSEGKCFFSAFGPIESVYFRVENKTYLATLKVRLSQFGTIKVEGR